jgi:hydrogenase expression/formation protein HypC
VCLAIPARLIEVDGDRGTADVGGTRREVALMLIDDPRPGQYVLLHAGFAIERIDEEEARSLTDLQREILFSESGDHA